MSSKSDSPGLIPIEGRSAKLWPSLAYYIAGFIDGEGCFRWSGTARASVTNTYIWALELLQHLFGGTIRPRAKKKPGHKQTYEWEISGPAAEHFAFAIEPYLREKRRQAQLVYRAGKYPPGSAERQEAIRLLHELKRYEYPRKE